MEEVGIARSIDADSRLDSLKEVFLFLPPFFPFPFIHILSFSPTFFLFWLDWDTVYVWYALQSRLKKTVQSKKVEHSWDQRLEFTFLYAHS